MMSSLTNLQCEVAQEIMGWTACRVRAGLLFGYPPDSTGEEHELEEVPAYAEDLLDARTVVAEMHRSGYSCEVSVRRQQP